MIAFDGTFRRPTEGDIAYVAAHMREADRRELKRWTGQDAAYELAYSVKSSDTAYTGVFADGTIACIFGGCRANIVDGTGVIWCLSTTDVDAHPKAYVRGTFEGVDRIMREMPDVGEFVNYVDLDYVGAIRWIEKMGGSFAMNTKRPGLRGGAFAQFYLTNPYYQED